MKPILNSKGFTLLEVMIALAIMLVSFSSILMIQSSSMNSALKSRQITEVSMLAKNAMAMTETEISGKKFDQLPDEASGQFESPYNDYTWTRKIKEVKLPNLAGLAAAQKKAEDSGNRESDEQNSIVVEQMTKVLTNFLSKAVREITITVSWKRGTRDQKYEIAMYWVDLNSEFQLNP